MDNTVTIQNITEYTQQIINGNLVLTRIIPFVDEALPSVSMAIGGSSADLVPIAFATVIGISIFCLWTYHML